MELVAESVRSRSVPRWFLHVVLAVCIAALGTAFSLWLNAELDNRKRQTAVLENLTEATIKLTSASETQSKQIGALATTVSRLVEEDLSEIRLEQAKINASGMLPGAVARFEKVDVAIANLSRSVDAVNQKMSDVVPRDVKHEVEQAEKRIAEQIRALRDEMRRSKPDTGSG